MLDITFQKATLDDVDTFLAIEKSVAHLKTYSAITTAKEAKEEIKNSRVYFIKKNGETVGSIEYLLKTPDHAHLTGFVVDQKFQRQGIGRAALIKLLNELKEMRRIDLATHPHNTASLILYLSQGFVIEAWKDNYFGDGQPRLVLARTQ